VIDVMLHGVILKLVVCTLATMGVWGNSRLLDIFGLKSKFGSLFDEIRVDPRAMAIYLAGRWAGLCLLYGLVLAFT
jgi:hypothetical protein